jgi:hypothetical protein
MGSEAAKQRSSNFKIPFGLRARWKSAGCLFLFARFEAPALLFDLLPSATAPRPPPGAVFHGLAVPDIWWLVDHWINHLQSSQRFGPEVTRRSSRYQDGGIDDW